MRRGVWMIAVLGALAAAGCQHQAALAKRAPIPPPRPIAKPLPAPPAWIVGTWTGTDCVRSEAGKPGWSLPDTLEFHADGTYRDSSVARAGTVVATGTYAVQGDTLLMTMTSMIWKGKKSTYPSGSPEGWHVRVDGSPPSMNLSKPEEQIQLMKVTAAGKRPGHKRA